MYWVAPFGHLRVKWSFAPYRSFSQLITSFIASESLGIHHAPLFCLLRLYLALLYENHFLCFSLFCYSTIVEFVFHLAFQYVKELLFHRPLLNLWQTQRIRTFTCSKSLLYKFEKVGTASARA